MLILMSYVCVYCRIHVNKLLSIYKLGRAVTSYLAQFLIPLCCSAIMNPPYRRKQKVNHVSKY